MGCTRDKLGFNRVQPAALRPVGLNRPRSERGAARAPEPAYDAKRRQDAEAKAASE